MSVLSQLHSQRGEILAVAARCGLKDIKIFGSVARGEERPDSDIDFLVTYDPGSKKGWEAFEFPIAMERMFGRRVDMVFESGLYHFIRDAVLKEARPI